MRFDLDRLLECADPQEIADAIGLETKRKGRYVFCECPSHRKVLGKPDNEIGNCVLTDHGYHCFACNTSGTVYQMVMDYCNCSFAKAVKIVASNTCGCFSIDDTVGEKATKKMPFSAEDLELIGLKTLSNPKGDAGREIIGVSYTRPETGVYFRRGDEYVSYAATKRVTLNQLFREDERLYYELIADNAEIYLNKYKALLESFEHRGSREFEVIFNLLVEDGTLDAIQVADIKNALRVNIRRTERILKEAKTKAL